MHTELAAVFAEHTNPTHASKDDIHAELRTITRLASRAQKQVIEYGALIDDALHAPHDPAYDGKVEYMRQTFGAMQREAEALALAARNLGQTYTQLDRYVEEWKVDLARIDAEKTPDPDAAHEVTVAK